LRSAGRNICRADRWSRLAQIWSPKVVAGWGWNGCCRAGCGARAVAGPARRSRLAIGKAREFGDQGLRSRLRQSGT
jgi:hypothetical protein